MGNLISQIFMDPYSLPQGGGGIIILLFHILVYGYILSKSSNMISDGSELLLLIPSLAGIVGSVVLPVLGAVPDGAIVIFSGLGDDAQTQLQVGVGALAGSTIMLLTIPWAICIYKGRVDLKNGEANYKGKTKLSPENKWSWTRAGVTPSSSIALNGKIMMATAISYLFIQIPAFADRCGLEDLSKCKGAGEHWWGLVALLLCIIAFVGYLIYCVIYASKEDQENKVEAIKKHLIESHVVSLVVAFQQELAQGNSGAEVDAEKHFNNTIRTFFNRYDENKDGTIDRYELRLLLKDVGEDMNEDAFDAFLKEIDTDGSGIIEFDEFAVAMKEFVKRADGHELRLAAAQKDGKEDKEMETKLKRRSKKNGIEISVLDDVSVEVNTPTEEEKSREEEEAGEEEEDVEEEEEVPEDLAHLPPNKQKMRILWRSAWMMGLGTIITLLFSDPMVDVFSALGERISVPPFYVAFILAPIASNASELIASINYAKKKTRKTITISLSALEGAASMNNSFCLGLFLILIVARNLVWEFSAETISIIIVELCLFAMSFKKTHTMVDAAIIMSFYPISLFLVAMIEYGGLN